MRPLMIALVLGALLSAETRPAERIAFSRIFPQPGEIGLFIANADGSEERPAGSPTDLDYNAAWAPDGKSYAFTSERNGSADLYRVRLDGSGLERLTDSSAYDDQASFSPDGRRLVFVSTRGTGTSDLWTLDLTTHRATRVTSGKGGDFRPAWSPDGRWIAFASDRPGELPFAHGRWEHLQLADIYIVRPDGSGLKRLTPRGGFCGSPKWYADSRRLVAYCMTAEQTLDARRRVPRADPTRLVTIDAQTGLISDLSTDAGVKFNPSMLSGEVVAYVRKDGTDAGVRYSNGTAGPRGEVRGAAWSPDGHRVLFHRRLTIQRKPFLPTWSRDSGYELTLVNNNASFSSSGDRLTFAGVPQNARGAGLNVVEVGTAVPRTIFRDPERNVLGPQWSPDGQQIIFGIGVFDAFYNGFHGLFLKAADRVEGGAQVALVNGDGSGYRELTSGPNNNAFPSMSPSGKQFVYRTFGGNEEGLRVMDVETRQVTKLTEGYDNFPLWSPRGDLIMFSRQADGDYEVYTIRPDGTGLKRLTRARGNDAHMAWSPDGQHLVFTSSRAGFRDEMIYSDVPQPYGDIFVMRADGTDVHQLTDNQWEEGTPTWQAFTPGGPRTPLQ